MSALTNSVRDVLSSRHTAAVYNDYGRCISAGYTAVEGSSGRARITHAIPDPDLCDDDRVADDDLAAERHRMVAAYAVQLESAGCDVEERGITSRRPYLLVRPSQ